MKKNITLVLVAIISTFALFFSRAKTVPAKIVINKIITIIERILSSFFILFLLDKVTEAQEGDQSFGL